MEPETETVKVPETSTVKSPATSPVFQPGWQPFPFPTLPLPLPGRQPDNPNPAPVPQQPLFPTVPVMSSVDWAKYFSEASKTLPSVNNVTPAQKMFRGIISPIIKLLALNELKKEYIKVNVTDPIYTKLLADPVLGMVLREAQKANMDAETVGTILANFDWENGNYKDLEKTLAVSVGVAGATRLIVFIIGRKVIFRI